MFRKPFFLLLIFYGSYSWFTAFSRSVLPSYFLGKNLNFEQIIFGTLLALFGQLFALFVFRRLTSKISWRAALISAVTYIILIMSFSNIYQYYLASFINGMALFFFYVFYNIAHVEHTPKENRGHSSAIMFAVPSAISIIAPLAAGFFTQINIVLLWTFSIVSFAIAIFLVNFQKNFEVEYDIRSAIKEIKPTRIFIFIEGIWEALTMGLIPVYTLFFIKTPLNYGIFISYLGIISIIANLTLGKITDRLQRRIIFLYPLTTVMGILTILFIFVKTNIFIWILLTGLIQFLLPIFWSLTFTMVVDTHTNLRLAIPGREIFLATSRALGILMVFLSFKYEKSPNLIFIFLGVTILMFPVLLFWKSKIAKHHNYL
jgi:hypothetical protein